MFTILETGKIYFCKNIKYIYDEIDIIFKSPIYSCVPDDYIEDGYKILVYLGKDDGFKPEYMRLSENDPDMQEYVFTSDIGYFLILDPKTYKDKIGEYGIWHFRCRNECPTGGDRIVGVNVEDCELEIVHNIIFDTQDKVYKNGYTTIPRNDDKEEVL